VQDHLAHLTAIAEENILGMQVIQSYAKESDELARFSDVSDNYVTANIRLVKTRALLYVLIAAVSGLSLLAVLGEGGREVIAGQLTLSSLAAFMLYLERLAWPTVSMGWMLSTFQQGMVAQERINQILAEKPSIPSPPVTTPITTIPEGPLEIRHLTFRYDNPYMLPGGAVPPWVLQDISLTISPGELVVLVGPIGAGKTTLLHLLARLYEPPPETLFWSGIPTEHISVDVLRAYATLMPQQAFLFSDTVAANIAYAQGETSPRMDEVIAMAQAAHIHHDIMGFTKTYQTPVGERGITLSGGQRQRTTLARTMLFQAPFLLLDDPFSNVDSDTEAAIIQTLLKRHQTHRQTTLVATQRLAIARHADNVVVLTEDGRLDAMGTHSHLRQTSVLYRALERDSQQPLVEGD
jgi:ATP-binding cassette subfamily B protein